MRDDIDLAYFKQRLEKRLTGIVAGQEARKAESPVELDQTRVGRLSRMDAMQQQAWPRRRHVFLLSKGNVSRPR